jgi:hypothetical protein
MMYFIIAMFARESARTSEIIFSIKCLFDLENVCSTSNKNIKILEIHKNKIR